MTAIKVENLSKRYIIDHQKKHSHYRYNTLGGALTDCGKRVYQQLRHPFYSSNNTVEHEEFWALKDINFEIQQGDKVGIIGRNGAGKSTLLKILSRITAPTTGKITINGRVSSLLEVGTGFHPELTGRENIFLNGAILGMKRQEIKAKFDEIVAFAEVEKFLDTPVKHYSSGMYVRLAFAVAAHLEPEILIVDEVLAVGDAQFQKKCLGKMEAVGKEGRTILFVSHDLKTIRTLCNLGIYLEAGRLVAASTSNEIIELYVNSMKNELNGYWKLSKLSNKTVYFDEISIKNESLMLSDIIPSTELFFIDILINSIRKIENIQIHIRFTNSDGVAVLTTANVDCINNISNIKQGKTLYRVNIPANFLQHGYYSLIFAIMIVNVDLFDEISNKISFKIEDYGNHSTIFREGRKCVVTPIFQWDQLL